VGNPFVVTFAEIVQQARDGEEGLVHLKKELTVEHPALWACDHHEMESIEGSMPTSGLKVALQVSKEHRHEMQDALNCTVHRLSSHLFFLAKRYVEAKNYLAAAPWAELHLLHVKQYETAWNTMT
jgi:hypothetical protein